jgi:hypothetical protein
MCYYRYQIFLILPHLLELYLVFLDYIPVARRSKARVCGRSPAVIAGSNPAGGHGCLSVVSVVCCQVEVSATSYRLWCVLVCDKVKNNPLHLPWLSRKRLD